MPSRSPEGRVSEKRLSDKGKLGGTNSHTETTDGLFIHELSAKSISEASAKVNWVRTPLSRVKKLSHWNLPGKLQTPL
jgi:hypothetical protein